MDARSSGSALRRFAAVAVTLLLLAACGGGTRTPRGADGRLPSRCKSFVKAAPAAKPQPRPDHPETWLGAYGEETAPDTLLDVRRLDLATTVRQLHSFSERQRFTASSSGVVVVVHSNGDITVDPHAVDELLHAHLRHHDDHATAERRGRMRCYADAILNDREFAGTVVNLYVPADPRSCIRDLRLVQRRPGRWGDSCDWSGVTPPVELAGFLGEIRSKEFHMLVAPGVAGNGGPGVARALRHESDHLWDWMMGQEFDFVANERRAQAGDAVVSTVHKVQGHAWPAPFGYP